MTDNQYTHSLCSFLLCVLNSSDTASRSSHHQQHEDFRSERYSPRMISSCVSVIVWSGIVSAVPCQKNLSFHVALVVVVDSRLCDVLVYFCVCLCVCVCAGPQYSLLQELSQRVGAGAQTQSHPQHRPQHLLTADFVWIEPAKRGLGLDSQGVPG